MSWAIRCNRCGAWPSSAGNGSDGVRAGETISTGSMTGMLPIRGGQHVRARFGDVTTIEITIEP